MTSQSVPVEKTFPFDYDYDTIRDSMMEAAGKLVSAKLPVGAKYVVIEVSITALDGPPEGDEKILDDQVIHAHLIEI